MRDCQLQGLLAVGLVMTLLMAWFLLNHSGFHLTQALYHGALNALSAQSTAGFSTLDISQIDVGSKLVLIFAMFLGGGVGSTAGGVKLLRVFILIRVVHLMVQRAGMPKEAILEARLGGRRLELDEIQNALTVILVFVALIAVSWLAFTAMGHNPLDSLFEVVSAIGTVGLSSGISTPQLHPLLKGILCADMLLGRLEILAWLVLFYPHNWIGRRLEE